MIEARGFFSRFVAAKTAFVVLLLLAAHAQAQNELSSELSSKIDKLATDALASSGVPSASIAVVKDGKIVYLKAYG